jgi:hypothetical protein
MIFVQTFFKGGVSLLHEIDLRSLAEMYGPEHAFVSAYLTGQEGLTAIESRANRIRSLLEEGSDESIHFEESYRMVLKWLEEHQVEEGQGLCVFASYVLEFVQGYSIPHKVQNGLRLGPTPYIRPLAELQEEYQKFVLVAADNKETQIYLVAADTAELKDEVKGHVKNRVKKGGWSQKRYARRREKELFNYAKDVVGALEQLNREESFDRIILLGSQETMKEIEEELGNDLKEKLVGNKRVDLNSGTDELVDHAYELFFQEERESERDLWHRIKDEYFSNNLAAVGAEDVLMAILNGRVDSIVINRDAKIKGTLCRECENISANQQEICGYCNKNDVLEIDLVNELVRHAELTGAYVNFVDTISGLSRVGEVAALLRY